MKWRKKVTLEELKLLQVLSFKEAEVQAKTKAHREESWEVQPAQMRITCTECQDLRGKKHSQESVKTNSEVETYQGQENTIMK
jgi:hypothetical protein